MQFGIVDTTYRKARRRKGSGRKWMTGRGTEKTERKDKTKTTLAMLSGMSHTSLKKKKKKTHTKKGGKA